jgi:hypothetical protein
VAGGDKPVRIEQPRDGEPIRLIMLKSGQPRYRVTLDGPLLPDGRRRQVRSTHPSLTKAREHILQRIEQITSAARYFDPTGKPSRPTRTQHGCRVSSPHPRFERRLCAATKARSATPSEHSATNY